MTGGSEQVVFPVCIIAEVTVRAVAASVACVDISWMLQVQGDVRSGSRLVSHSAKKQTADDQWLMTRIAKQ